jgi:hypothetical protein
MTADHSRNIIASAFLESKAEWLFWIDSDTVVPIGSISRLLAVGKTMVSGLYYGKHDPHPPIAYVAYNGTFTPVDKTRKWEKGEIIPIDAAGMGCMLTHRSVFEDIQANHEIFMRPGGALAVLHKDIIIGDVVPDTHKDTDGKVFQGQLRERLSRPNLSNLRWPFFLIQHGRTEDMHFFDLARNVGHKPWLDTSVECQHLRWKGFDGNDYRSIYGF